MKAANRSTAAPPPRSNAFGTAGRAAAFFARGSVVGGNGGRLGASRGCSPAIEGGSVVYSGFRVGAVTGPSPEGGGEANPIDAGFTGGGPAGAVAAFAGGGAAGAGGATGGIEAGG